MVVGVAVLVGVEAVGATYFAQKLFGALERKTGTRIVIVWALAELITNFMVT